MFEFIGMLVVVYIVWQILKGVSGGASRARSIDFGKEARRIATIELGVPDNFYNFSVRNNMDDIDQLAEELKNNNSNHTNDSWPRLMAYAIYYSYNSEKELLQSVNPLFHPDEHK